MDKQSRNKIRFKNKQTDFPSFQLITKNKEIRVFRLSDKNFQSESEDCLNAKSKNLKIIHTNIELIMCSRAYEINDHGKRIQITNAMDMTRE